MICRHRRLKRYKNTTTTRQTETTDTYWISWHCYDYFQLTSKKKTNRGTDREQCIKSIAPTVTPPTPVRLAENLTTRLTDDLPWKAGLPTWNGLPSTSVDQYRHHTNDSFTTLTLQTNRTERPNFTNGSRPTNHDWPTPLESYSP